MSSGKAAARDVRHGRRGGGWIEGDISDRPSVAGAPACPTCGFPMTVGQTNGHATCVGLDEAFATTKRRKAGR